MELHHQRDAGVRFACRKDENMFIKGYTYGFDGRRGAYQTEEAALSMERLAELGALLKEEFGTPLVLLTDPEKEEQSPDYQPAYRIPLPRPLAQSALRHIVIREKIALGQRVESFRVKARYQNGRCYSIFEGTCIGNRRICEFTDPFALQNPLTDDRDGTKVTELIVQITAARGPVSLREISVY